MVEFLVLSPIILKNPPELCETLPLSSTFQELHSLILISSTDVFDVSIIFLNHSSTSFISEKILVQRFLSTIFSNSNSESSGKFF